MSVEVDWQIIDEDEPWALQPAPEIKPQRRASRRWMLAVALIPVLAIATAAAFVAWMYHARLDQATTQVQQVARLELQSAAAGDRASFMALQDPDDPAWRTRQERIWGRLGLTTLQEFGWEVTDATPQLGQVSLEPGGAIINIAHQFTVALPMSGGPTTATLQVPQFWRPTPSGWVHAMPGADFWGTERTQSGKRVTVLYLQRDADIVEPLIPHMDDLVARLCDPLPCPSQISVAFDNSTGLRRGSLGGGEIPTVRLTSPHLVGLPADTASRDELYRAFQIQLVRTLVSRASGRGGYTNRLPSSSIVQWELARVALAEPVITEATGRRLASSPQPLAAISLRSNIVRLDASGDLVMSLALHFLDQTLGAGTVERLIPVVGRSATLGEAIRTGLQVDPKTLEEAWQRYLQDYS
jgi:type II secretory pathway pseudopilin PulG